MSAEGPEYEVLHQGRYVRLVRKNGWEFVERDGITGIVVVVLSLIHISEPTRPY